MGSGFSLRVCHLDCMRISLKTPSSRSAVSFRQRSIAACICGEPNNIPEQVSVRFEDMGFTIDIPKILYQTHPKPYTQKR